MNIDTAAVARINRQTVDRYDRRLSERGPGAYALGWGKKRYQTKRFFDLLHALPAAEWRGRSVLDVGCGLADLYPFLRRRGVRLRSYRGADINPRLLKIAGERYPDCRFEERDIMLAPYRNPAADIVVSLGVINFKTSGHAAYTREFIRRAFSAARRILVLNAISDVHNDEYPREPFIHYHPPAAIFSYAQSLTPFCSLVHDYKGLPQHEFMLVMRRRPKETHAL